MESLITMIVSWFGGENSAVAPFLTGAVGMWALTVLTYLCRFIPSKIALLWTRFFTTSLIVTTESRTYFDLIDMFTKILANKKLYSWKASTGKTGRYADTNNTLLSFGYGTHYMILRKMPVKITLVTRQDQVDGEHDTLTITKLGKDAKFFTTLIKELNETISRTTTTRIYNYSTGTKCWHRAAMQTPRAMNTVILSEEVDTKLRATIDRFIKPETEKWYTDRGMPYQLGILLYGPPGTGKTSIIKALAAYTQRNLYVVSSAAFVHLADALADSDISSDGMVVIEDIDNHLSPPEKEEELHDDDLEQSALKPSKKKKKAASGFQANLSDVLNAIDGVCTTHGRIMVISTNFVDMLPPALVRPGRIDLKFEIGYFDLDMFNRFLKLMYDEDATTVDKDRVMLPNITGAVLQCDVQQGLTCQELIDKYTQ